MIIQFTGTTNYRKFQMTVNLTTAKVRLYSQDFRGNHS